MSDYERIVLSGKELIAEIFDTLQNDATTEEIAEVAKTLGMYKVINIDENQDLITVEG